MTELQRLLETARSELGVSEAPSGSNCVRYNTDYYGREVSGSAYPWCCVFVWWCFWKAGLQNQFYGGGRTASCGTLAAYARRQGQFVEEGYQPGDLVFFHFSGTAIEHIGIVEQVNTDGSLTTLEGNTGSSNDANGGQVQRRVRLLRYAAGAYRPEYGKEETVTYEQWKEYQTRYETERAELEPGDWSREARLWAEENGIVQGDTAGVKKYRSACTREQMAVFLFRLWQKLSAASGGK